MAKPPTMMLQGDISNLYSFDPFHGQYVKKRYNKILLKCQKYISQECIELSQNDDQEKRRREEIDWLGWLKTYFPYLIIINFSNVNK